MRETPMTDTPSWIQARIEEMLPTLNGLLTAPEVPFDERLHSALPEDPGIYVITTRAASNGQFIRAGKTASAFVNGSIGIIGWGIRMGILDSNSSRTESA